MTSAAKDYKEISGEFERYGELGEGAFGKVYLAEKIADKGAGIGNENTFEGNKMEEKES